VIALVGFLRYRQHQSLPEIHRILQERGLPIGERTVLTLLARYEEMQDNASLTIPLHEMTATFLKVTRSYWPGLFHCYDVVDLPRTNNDLEHVFGSTRYHERRATGRKQASPGLVVRGSVCIVAAAATQNSHFSGSDLAPHNLAEWRTLRKQIDYRHEARREQHRFRKDPEHYLRALEERLSQRKMPS
jgi:hypothetical protein